MNLITKRILAITIGLLVSGCDLFRDPPTQLSAVIVLREFDEEKLLIDILHYLNVAGLKEKNVRLRFDEKIQKHVFQIVGKNAFSQSQLDQIGAKLRDMDNDRSWSGTLAIKDEAMGIPSHRDRRFRSIVTGHSGAS